MIFLLTALLMTSLVQRVSSTEIGDLRDLVQAQQDSISVLQATVNRLSVYHKEKVVLSTETTTHIVYAVCPVYYKLMGCSSTDLAYSNGPFIRGARCVTSASRQAAYAGVAVMARAVCAPAEEVGHVKYVYSSSAVINPAVSCTGGYSMIDCMVNTRHGERYADEAFPRGVVRGNSCESDRACRADSGCRAYAICQKF